MVGIAARRFRRVAEKLLENGQWQRRPAEKALPEYGTLAELSPHECNRRKLSRKSCRVRPPEPANRHSVLCRFLLVVFVQFVFPVYYVAFGMLRHTGNEWRSSPSVRAVAGVVMQELHTHDTLLICVPHCTRVY